MTQPKTILDASAGIGRAIKHLEEALPGVIVRAVEPVAASIKQAVQQGGVSKGANLPGAGEALPVEDVSIDVVCASSMLHHDWAGLQGCKLASCASYVW